MKCCWWCPCSCMTCCSWFSCSKLLVLLLLLLILLLLVRVDVFISYRNWTTSRSWGVSWKLKLRFAHLLEVTSWRHPRAPTSEYWRYTCTVCVSLYLSVSTCIYEPVCLPVSLYPSLYCLMSLSTSLSLSLPVSVPICLSVPVLCSDWLYCN